MRKLIATALVATFVFAAAFASASALTVTGGSLQSGTVSVSCQTNPVNVTYTTQFTGAGVNEVKTVTLHGIDPSCVGDQALVMLMSNGLGTGQTWYAWDTISAAGDKTMDFTAHNATNPPVETVNYLNVMFSAQ